MSHSVVRNIIISLWFGVTSLFLPGQDTGEFEARKQKVASGDRQAQFELAEAYANGLDRGRRDYALAAEWYRKAADQNHPRACTILGQLYQFGFGVPKDPSSARRWVQRGAELNDPLGLYLMGEFMVEGLGAPAPSPSAALAWYRRAAEAGWGEAQCRLGQAYKEGKLLPRDPVEAFAWFSAATKRGSGQASVELTKLRFGSVLEARAQARRDELEKQLQARGQGTDPTLAPPVFRAPTKKKAKSPSKG